MDILETLTTEDSKFELRAIVTKMDIYFWQRVVALLDENSAFRLAVCCRQFYYHLELRVMKYTAFNQATIMQPPFRHLRKLAIRGVNQVYSLGHLSRLSHLSVACCRLPPGALVGLTGLVSLNLTDARIPSIAHMVNLTELRMVSCEEVEGVASLSSLVYLRSVGTILPDLSGLSRLTRLVSYRCDLDHGKVKSLGQILILETRDMIESVNHMANLRKLTVESSAISQEGIALVTNLHTLSIYRHRGLTSLNHLINLTSLDITSVPFLMQEDISALTNLRDLRIYDVPGVWSVNHLPKLEILAAGIETITQDGIRGATSLTCLDISNSVEIVSVSHLVNLTNLRASSFVKQKELESLTGLRRLSLPGDTRVKSATGLTQLEALTLHGPRFTYEAYHLKKFGVKVTYVS